MVSIFHAARDLARIRTISRVLVRHGFGEVVSRLGIRKGADDAESDPPTTGSGKVEAQSTAERIRHVLEDLGTTFVKLGQIGSTRADLLPASLIVELQKLQDGAPPIDFEDVRIQVERALGAPLAELFSSFDEVPLAAASVAQVHRATLDVDGVMHDVGVKVQRPGIAETVASDLDILHTLAALIERTIPESHIYSPVALVQQFDLAITAELDFAIEAENAARFAQNFIDDNRARFPVVFHQRSSKYVVTLEYLDGKKVYDAIHSGFAADKLIETAISIGVKQIFEDGFFHADPHPGNILILGSSEHPIYGMLDLGMVGRLNARMRDLTVDLVVAAARRDYEGIADAMLAIGTPKKKIDMDQYRGEVARVAEKYLDLSIKDIAVGELFGDLLRGTSRFGIQVPPDFVLVGKALMTIEGVAKQIDPDLNVMEAARPHFMHIIRKRYSPERIGDELLRRLERLSGVTNRLPEHLTEILEDLRHGRLSLQTHDPEGAYRTDRLGRRIFSGVVTGSLLMAGATTFAHSRAVGVLLIVFGMTWLVGHTLFDLYRSFGKKH